MGIKFALDLEPKKAIEFLESKKVFSKNLDKEGLQNSARARAARIANLSSLELTANIYQSMADAKRDGQFYSDWVKDVHSMLERKGWTAHYDKESKEHLIVDSNTGEVFGSPRRLETIYRTNMQSALSAQRYQQLMDNVDNRPYWQYSAILDSRTRPRHASMHGLVFRYDDPFWATFYPPNGFNCRCSVKALKQRDLDRNHLQVSNSKSIMVDAVIEPRKGEKKITKGLKLADGSVVVTDNGFDHNVGRRVYKPNLELYPEELAHEFAKKEMQGDIFKLDYSRLEQEMNEVKKQLGLVGKLNNDQLRLVSNNIRQEYKFAVGILTKNLREKLNSSVSTVWLSDDTLLKQFNSRINESFGINDYTILPDLIRNPDKVTLAKDKRYQFIKDIHGKKYSAIIKPLEGEIFIASLRRMDNKEWNKLMVTR
ncbi:phage minor head protein [Otariodibacter oris]|uniref:SPP1 gp7 family putative phage head morphogenesis protein n=1 Tax=Otariodibacter oris TaxID=1032623 RepID=A0A420XJA1_9PAST|nr:phage minor head protein [Otariodibacter oris]QGM80669.1 phage head morphogenesis protein [Otariodibacter oris]RKR77170.1 SPP1 gp7 family putative phage head morphogenesis protein [Otariodibacter oris]